MYEKKNMMSKNTTMPKSEGIKLHASLPSIATIYKLKLTGLGILLRFNRTIVKQKRKILGNSGGQETQKKKEARFSSEPMILYVVTAHA